MIRRVYKLKAGNLKDLKLHDEPIEMPGSNEVLIEVRAVGLNFADVFAIWGLYSATPKGVFTPGLEFSGIIVHTGENVTEYKIGDRVMGVTRFGGYATHVISSPMYLRPLPENWTFEEGAGYLVQVLTAYYGLKYLGDIQSEKTILIHSAAGGVGIWATRIAKKMGCFTIGTVSHPDKIPTCLQEGCNRVIVRDPANFSVRLMEVLDGNSLDLVMEATGGKILQQSFDALAPMGRLIAYGSAQYAHVSDKPNLLKLAWMYLQRPKIDVQNIINTNRSILAFNLIYLYQQAGLMNKILEEIHLLDLGKPYVGHKFHFDEAQEAIRYFQSGKTTGKVVLNIT
jgi:NADPH:quinone reductase-like Zn-dependent oxidoreductase